MDDGKSEETSYPPCHRPPAFSFFLSPASLRHNRALQRREVSSQRRGNVLPFLVLKLYLSELPDKRGGGGGRSRLKWGEPLRKIKEVYFGYATVPF